jgi:hypothetical protein
MCRYIYLSYLNIHSDGIPRLDTKMHLEKMPSDAIVILLVRNV